MKTVAPFSLSGHLYRSFTAFELFQAIENPGHYSQGAPVLPLMSDG